MAKECKANERTGLRSMHFGGIKSVTVCIPFEAFEDLWIDFPDSTPEEVIVRALSELNINIGADVPGEDW